MAKKQSKGEELQNEDNTVLTPEQKKKAVNDESLMKAFRDLRKPLDLDFLRNTHVHYFTPCYGGMLTEGFFRSWTKTNIMYTKYDIPYSLTTGANESLITRARCQMTAYFMANPKATHMMFIDADITFDPVDILHMIQWDKDIITGAYPKKSIGWNSVQVAADAGLRGTELEDTGAEYAVNYKAVDVEKPDGTVAKQLAVENGLVELHDGATGFMLIKREVIEKMIEAYPEMYFNNDLNLPEEVAKYTYLFFDCMHEPETKRYLSEDYAFCRRWQNLGGKVWLDPCVKLDHMGSYNFKGNISKMFHRT